MRVVITGAGGLMGRGLTERLLARGTLAGRPITELALSDRTAPPIPDKAPFRVTSVACDVRDPAAVADAVGTQADIVFHLAAIMSGAAERDFPLGWAINLDGTRNVLDACARMTAAPRFIFTSTIALYGPDVAIPVRDDYAVHPRTPYGTQKLIMELMIDEYSRKGYVDGRMVRVSHVCIREDDTHQGAGGFITAVLKAPLFRRDAVCPVPLSTRVGIITPETVFASLLHLTELPPESFTRHRVVQLPALTMAVGDMIEAVRRYAGDAAMAHVRVERDAEFERLLAGMPSEFVAARARALGFPITPDIDTTIRQFIAKTPALAGLVAASASY